MHRSLAALLVFFLSAMTSWASACDLSCSFQRSHAICKLGAPALASRAVPAVPSSDMAMANMDMPERSITAQPSSGKELHLHPNPCVHNSCNETSAMAAATPAHEHAVHALTLIAFEHPFFQPMSLRAAWPTPEEESPGPPPFDLLSVTLRI